MNKKKALIISYYWPPAGGPGVQRWLKFVKYLPEFGIEPIVYIPKNPNYPIIDNSLVRDVPDGITILKQTIKEPYKWASLLSNKSAKTISKGVIPAKKKQNFIEKIMLYIRGNFFIPDARKAWVAPSVEFLSTYIQDHKIETIITTGPPHSLHLIGLQLKNKISLKWIADFRDPWTTIGYHKKLKLTKASTKKHRQLETLVLNTADQIVVTSNVTKNEFLTITEKPISVITNGYDSVAPKIVSLDKKFTISHIGSLLSDRNPENLWKTLSELISKNDSFAQSFQLNLIGTVSEDVLQSVYKHNLKPYINVIGYVSHKEAITYQYQSQLLLLVEINSEDTKCIIPGKLFEYMVSNRPIIAVGPANSDVEIIIEDTNSGHYFCYEAYTSLKSVVLDYFESYKKNDLKNNPIGIEKYSRKELTKSLSELI